jgi:hypothetical protein
MRESKMSVALAEGDREYNSTEIVPTHIDVSARCYTQADAQRLLAAIERAMLSLPEDKTDA